MSTVQSAGGAWKKTINTKNGPVEILSISIEGQRYTAWPNTFKKDGDKTPDYRLQVDTYQPKADAPKSFAGQDNSDLPF